MKSFKNMPHMFQESDSLAIKLEVKMIIFMFVHSLLFQTDFSP